MQAAPLWDSSMCQFVGLLTVCDFIDLLLLYKKSGQDVAALATTSIAEILSLQQQTPTFFGVDSTCTLHRACQLLLQLSAKRGPQDYLPVVYPDDMRVLACITYTTILEFLVTHFREQRRLFDDSISDLRIGTYSQAKSGDSDANAVITVYPHETLNVALERMAAHQLSAIPVIDAVSNKILGVYARSDITFLTKAVDAHDAILNLNQPISDILLQQQNQSQQLSQSRPTSSLPSAGGNTGAPPTPPTTAGSTASGDSMTATTTTTTTPDAVRTCYATHTLQAIFESFAISRFNRLYVIEPASEKLIGVISARDLVEYFLRD
jgi:5'-AMP-activated protein kinase, regulatory gamma subunit